MTRIAVTGPEAISKGGHEMVHSVMPSLVAGTEFISGAAEGVDTLFALLAYDYFPRAKHTICVPRARHNRILVEHFQALTRLNPDADIQILLTPVEPKSKNPHIFRDEYMISLLAGKDDLLLAFPHTSKEVLRSGTWTTIRRAREADTQIFGFPLNSDKPWNENIRKSSGTVQSFSEVV
jgi:hypothetical protein